jgi:uncharacterized protein (DUF2342 family)
MGNLFLSLLAVAVLAGSQPAKPNFTGEWAMNAAKSSFGAIPPPTSLTRSIKHDEPALAIVEKQEGALGDPTTTRKYVTDGTPTTFESQGTTVSTSAKWMDNALVVVSNVEAVGLSFNDNMTLSADGKTMTSVVRITSPQGDVEMTVVFDRQK